MSVSTVSRSDGRSATAAAAYRSGTAIHDERTGELHDYERRGGIERTGLTGWQGTREQLWNEAEASEKRKNSQVAREVQLALPRELGAAERWALTESMATWLHQRFGVAVDAAMHCPHGRDGDEQPHAHLLMTTRRVSDAGELGAKVDELSNPRQASAHVEAMRAAWALAMNEALAAAGEAARVEHKSYARQGIHREREHIGRTALALESKGVHTERAREIAGAIERNDERAELARVTVTPRPRRAVKHADPIELERIREHDREAGQERRAIRREQGAAQRVAKMRQQENEQPPELPAVVGVPATGEQSPTPSEHSPEPPIVQPLEERASVHPEYHTPPATRRHR